MSKKWNLIVDIARCDNCRNCFLATKDEFVGNDFPGYTAAQPKHKAICSRISQKKAPAYPGLVHQTD